MKRTIRWQLILAFVLLSALIIGALSLITLRLVETHFQDYVSERQEELLTRFAGELEDSRAANGEWDVQEVRLIAQSARQNGVTLTLYDAGGEIVWDNPGMMGGGQGMHMGPMMGNAAMQYTEESLPLFQGTEQVGTVVLGYLGPIAYSELDLQFISDLQSYLLWIGLAALFVSILFATWVAGALSKPIVQVSRFTERIARGHFQEQLPHESRIMEVNDLVLSVNDLSQQLEQQQEIRNRLSSNLAHEIRTPLTTLKGNIEAMLDGVWDVTPERLENCQREVDRIARLIADIDHINAIESQQSPLKLEQMDLSALARGVAANFEVLALEKQLELTVAGEPLSIQADPDKISQVMTNLVANAIKFTPVGGKISLAVERLGDEALLRIQDNGEGIPPAELDKIFERFYMVEPSRNSRLGGKGIGLSIVKSLVQAHGGSITVESSPGEGTTFLVRLPVAPAVH